MKKSELRQIIKEELFIMEKHGDVDIGLQLEIAIDNFHNIIKLVNRRKTNDKKIDVKLFKKGKDNIDFFYNEFIKQHK